MNDEYQCDYCTRLFSDVSGIERHIREHLAIDQTPTTIHHKSDHEETNAPPTSNIPQSIICYGSGTIEHLFKRECVCFCSICNSSFTNSLAYQAHADKERVLMQCQCKDCRLFFESQESLERHHQENRCEEFVNWLLNKDGDLGVFQQHKYVVTRKGKCQSEYDSSNHTVLKEKGKSLDSDSDAFQEEIAVTHKGKCQSECDSNNHTVSIEKSESLDGDLDTFQQKISDETHEGTSHGTIAPCYYGTDNHTELKQKNVSRDDNSDTLIFESLDKDTFQQHISDDTYEGKAQSDFDSSTSNHMEPNEKNKSHGYDLDAFQLQENIQTHEGKGQNEYDTRNHTEPKENSESFDDASDVFQQHKHVVTHGGKVQTKSCTFKSGQDQASAELVYQCGECGLAFSQFKEWSDHEESHLDACFHCIVCQGKYSGHWYYRRHIEKRHKTPGYSEQGKLFACTVCDERFGTAWDLLMHFENHIDKKPFKCFSCKCKFAYLQDLRKHKAKKYRNGNYNALKAKAELRDIDPYNESRSFRCRTCTAKYHQQSVFILHQTVHFGNICQICHTHIGRLSELKHHFAGHIGLVQCRSCNSSFKNNTLLLAHGAYCSLSPFVCYVCDENFPDVESLISHKQLHVKLNSSKPKKVMASTKSLKLKALICEECGKVFKGTYKFNRHQRTHTKSKEIHKCEICDSKHHSYKGLMLHCYWHHNIPKPYTCEICQKSFTAMQALKNHIKRHSAPQEAVFGCDKCDKRFVSKKLLRQHSNVHMADSKPFKCDQCEVAFAQNCNLTKHKIIHTGESPYKCNECGAAYNHRSSLIKHKYIHSGEFPFKCDLCTCRFPSNNVLQQHKRNNHTGLSMYTKVKKMKT